MKMNWWYIKLSTTYCYDTWHSFGALFDHLGEEEQPGYGSILFKYNVFDAIFDIPGVGCFHPAVLLPGVSALTHLRIPLHHVFSPSSLITPSIIMLPRRPIMLIANF